MTSNWFHQNIMSSSSSDEEDINKVIYQHMQNNHEMYVSMVGQGSRARGDSIKRRKRILRDRESGDADLFNDYFSESPTYNDVQFRHRFRMSRELFLRIVDAVKTHDPWFAQGSGACGKKGLSTLQKINAAFRILAYGIPADTTDEYIKIGESTAILCLRKFCTAIREIFAPQYLRTPTTADVARLLYIGEQRGFPGMLGSLDCMQWKWKNCPTSWQGGYASQSGHPTTILEIVADYDLWIWHAYFGMPDSNNDINVVETSHLFTTLSRGLAPPCHYVINGKDFTMGYYLADDKYPKCATIVQTIKAPVGPKKRYYVTRHEACRKDVKRAFVVLQSRFAIVANPVHYWENDYLSDIMIACIIMHNMIIEDERDLDAPIEVARDVPPLDIEIETPEPRRFQAFLSRFEQIKDADAQCTLQNELIEHLWNEYSNSED